ncbi:MAG TPA: hypothetical protein P5077_01265 [bacterium]|nr:hypothetical protein [bacterium]
MFQRGSIISIMLAAALFFAACGTSKAQYAGVDDKLRRGDYVSVAKQINDLKEKEYGEKNRVLFYLDLGMLMHYAGQYQQSNELLTQAENAIEELYTVSISKEAGAAIVNDNTREYSGEDYEDVYVNIFKAFNYLALNDAEGAAVEAKKVHIKINKLKDKYPIEDEEVKKQELPVFKESALAYYMSMLLYRMEKAWDDAEIDRKKLMEAMSGQKGVYIKLSNPEEAITLEDEALATAIPEGKGVVSVVSFNGLGPEKMARILNINTLGGGINISSRLDDKKDGAKADVRALFHYPQMRIPIPLMPPGYNFTVEFPEMVSKRPMAHRIEVVVDGTQKMDLFPIENISRVAEVTFAQKIASAYVKTLIRAGVKFAAAVVASEAANKAGGGLVGAITRFGTSTIASATEKADLRLSYFFPGEAFAGELALDPGEHQVTVTYYYGGGVIHQEKKTVTVKEGDLQVLETFYLGSR